jgi:hypothetical protein
LVIKKNGNFILFYPISDNREYFWCIDEYDVRFTEDENEFEEETDYSFISYSNEIIKDVHGGVYRGTDYTLVVSDSDSDSGCFLSIFDNSKEKELKDELEDIYGE